MSSCSSYDNFLFSGSEQNSENNEAIVKKLDELEAQVENLRTCASEIEDRRDHLTKCLTEVSETSNKSALTAGHREEIEANKYRLIQRLLGVNIKVEIPRTSDQVAAYNEVKLLLDDLLVKVKSGGLDDYGNRKLLASHLNACSPEPRGPVDPKFQQFILACTVDDQRQVRKKLKNWIQAYHELHEKKVEARENNANKL